MRTVSVMDHKVWHRQTHTETHLHSSPVSVPVLSHPVINISAISIIDRWISPLRCTKIIQTFLCWNWSINISPAGCLLKGWKVEGALLCFALLSYCAVVMKKHTFLPVCLSSLFLLCGSYPQISLMHSMFSLFLSSLRFAFSLPFVFPLHSYQSPTPPTPHPLFEFLLSI